LILLAVEAFLYPDGCFPPAIAFLSTSRLAEETSDPPGPESVEMPRILLSAPFSTQLIGRQGPLSRQANVCCWDEFEFLLEPDGQPIDGWTVFENLQQPAEQLCPPANTLFISGEPPSLRTYRGRFTSQFGHVWTSHTRLRHPRRHLQHEAQPWHYGMHPSQTHGQPLGFDELVHLVPPEKTKLASVICSGKGVTPDHLQRLTLVNRLQRDLGDRIDFFGRDSQPVEDKADAIYPYRYHIVLENDHSPHFMTEKLPDAFLGWSYPIYFGGPEAGRCFPRGSFETIDIYRLDTAIAKIRRILDSDLAETRAELIAEARQRVLFDHNLIARLAMFWRTHLQGQSPRNVSLYPKSHRVQLIVKQLSRLRRPFGHESGHRRAA
jgi:hypothetical protein